MNILMIGTGYVGLVTGTCLSEMGHTVTCYDIDRGKIEILNKGGLPIYEPGLSELITNNTRGGRLCFSCDLANSARDAEAIFLALPTPSTHDGGCDISYLVAAVKELAPHLHSGCVVVNKSTAPVGTVALLREEIGKHVKSGIEFDVVSNPEFLREGSAVADCMKPNRVIVGSDSEHATSILHEIYRPFMMSRDRFIVMDVASSEMTKYAANTMLAARISMMNEFARLCEATGADINQVRVGIGSDPRIGYGSIYAGLGFGGSCFPKDIRALRSFGKGLGIETEMINAIEKVNNRQKLALIEKLEQYFSQLEGKVIALWGLSYKPDTDDIREAPSIEMIDHLLQRGASVRLFDPAAMARMQERFPPSEDVVYCNSEYEAATGADAICLVTEWKQFRLIDFKKISPLVSTKVLFDGRCQYQPKQLQKLGFDYFGIGLTPSRLGACV